MMWKTGAQWSIDIIERDVSLDVIEEKEEGRLDAGLDFFTRRGGVFVFK